jgi:hypothetical protein
MPVPEWSARRTLARNQLLGHRSRLVAKCLPTTSVNATALGRTNPQGGCNQAPTSGLSVDSPTIGWRAPIATRRQYRPVRRFTPRPSGESWRRYAARCAGFAPRKTGPQGIRRVCCGAASRLSGSKVHTDKNLIPLLSRTVAYDWLANAEAGHRASILICPCPLRSQVIAQFSEAKCSCG